MKSSTRMVWLSFLLLASLVVFTACVEKPTPAPGAGSSDNQPTNTPIVLPTAAPTATDLPAVEPTAAVLPAPTEATGGEGVTISAALVLDPAITLDADSLMISQYLYSGLVQLDADGQPQPALAESWVVSEDGLDYIFKLRADARFSDGSPITPDVVKANFDRWFDPNNELHGDSSYTTWETTFLGFLGEKGDDDRPKSTVDGTEKVDQITVLIHLNRQVPEFLAYLANPAFSILSPEEIMAGNYSAAEGQLVTSGSYMIGSWTNEALTLVPNPNFWGEPAAEELSFTLK